MFAMLYRWKAPIRLANDHDGDDPGYFDYKEVTEEVLNEYNKYYNTQLVFTGNRAGENEGYRG